MALPGHEEKKKRFPGTKKRTAQGRGWKIPRSRGPEEKRVKGQAHYYFLLHLRGSKSLVNVAGLDAEFRSARWIRPAEFNLAWLPPMKRPTYRRVLRDFLGVRAKTKANSD